MTTTYDSSKAGDLGGRPPFRTPAEVARWLRVSPETIRRMSRRGDLPARRVDWQYQLFEDELLGALPNVKAEAETQTSLSPASRCCRLGVALQEMLAERRL